MRPDEPASLPHPQCVGADKNQWFSIDATRAAGNQPPAPRSRGGIAALVDTPNGDTPTGPRLLTFGGRNGAAHSARNDINKLFAAQEFDGSPEATNDAFLKEAARPIEVIVQNMTESEHKIRLAEPARRKLRCEPVVVVPAPTSSCAPASLRPFSSNPFHPSRTPGPLSPRQIAF